MQDVNVVIVFYSRTGTTERLALTAAVGAVQGRALIRLRRIAETASEETMASITGWREHHERMTREFIAPREVDMQWAEGLVVAIPEWMSLSSSEVKGFIDSIAGGKQVVAGVGPKGLSEALAAAGLKVVPTTAGTDALERARLAGVRVAQTVRENRQVPTLKP